MTEHYYNNNIDLAKFATVLTGLAAIIMVYCSFMA